MDSVSEVTFIDSDEDEICCGTHIRERIIQKDAKFLTMPSPDQSLEADGTEIPVSPVIKFWQDGLIEQTSTADKDMLLLALQQRFEKHKVDLPDLCDLNLDDTAAENESCAVNLQGQCNASLEFLANCSMPQFTRLNIDETLTPPLNLNSKSTGNSKDLDSTAKFLELEKSCITPNEPDEDCRERLLEMSSDDLSTVSADADGGFLTTLTNLALIHPSLNRDSITISPFPAAIKAHSDCGTLLDSTATCSESYTRNDREMILTSMSPMVHDKSIDEQFSDQSAADSTLNTTWEEMQMLEAYGAHYMVSAEKDLIKKGLESSINVSLSKDHQDILDSFVEQNKPTKPEVMRDISKAFEPCLSTLEMASTPVKDVTKDFQFPKPLSTIHGSQSKNRFRHQTTPMKHFSPKSVPIEKSAGIGNRKFFSSSTMSPLPAPKTKFFTGSPLNSPCHKTPTIRLNVPISSLKSTPDFKKIQSPIGHYINDSPLPSLMTQKHVPFAGLHKNKLSSIVIDKEKKASENIDYTNMALPPQKSYQSTSSLKKMMPSKTRLPMLSGKSKQLLNTPKAMVMKHTGRVKTSDLSSSILLSKTPAKINDSCFSEKTFEAEVSVVVAKEATKTSSIKS